MMTPKIVPLAEHREPGFRVVGIRGAVPMGHVLNVDHFHLSEPAIPPHPHAGFSAVTYMLAHSPGSLVNRDSRGDRTLLTAGSLHCTHAGSGIVHEEAPSKRGVDCHGLQIFVKLPTQHETAPPSVQHVEPSEVPRIERSGAILRVLLGAYEGVASPARLRAPTTLLELELRAGAALVVPLPPNEESFAFALAGRGSLAGVEIEAPSVCILPCGLVEVRTDTWLHVLVGHSPPLKAPVHWSGPFCMSDRVELAHAHERFRSGAMGSLPPST